jgi:hypothetical protein
MGEVLGEPRDLGALLAAMTRLAAADTVEPLCALEPAVANVMPPLEGAAARLANWLDGPNFAQVRAAIGRRVLTELTGPRRLRPNDAEAEIIVLRALAMALTAAAGRLLNLEDIHAAIIERSKTLVRADFVEDYLSQTRGPMGDVEALLWLAENVAGAGNKRQACHWIAANIGALKFETDVRAGPETAAAKLASLAELQRLVPRAGFAPEDAEPIAIRIGEVGGLVEADGRLTAALAKASAPVGSRLAALLRLASGDAAPLGPAADRAKLEVMRLMRLPDTRSQLAEAPDQLGRLRSLMQSAGLAA